MAAENQSAETSASHQRQKTHRQQKTLVSSHRQALTQNLTQLSHYLALRSALYYLLSLLIFIYYQTTSIHWEFCFSLISIHLEFYSSRNQVFQTRDQRHFPKKIKSWKLNFAFLRTQAFKTRDLYGIIIVCMVSNSKSKKQVFKPRVLYRTQFSKTQYTSLQLYFKRIVERTIFYTLTLLVSKIPWILRVKLLSPLDSHIDYKLFLFFSLLGLVQSFWELRHRVTQIWEKEKRNEWEQNKRSVLRRVVSSDPSRKHWRHRYSPSRQRHLQSPPLRLCWPLYIYPSLSLSSNSLYSNSTPHFSLFFQMTPSAIPRSSETLTAPSSSAGSLATPPKTLFTRSLLFSTLALSVWLLRKLKGK